MTTTKKRLLNCDFRAVLHSCNYFTLGWKIEASCCQLSVAICRYYNEANDNNDLQFLLSFPGQADWMSSIRKACVLVLFYVRHLVEVEVYDDDDDHDDSLVIVLETLIRQMQLFSVDSGGLAEHTVVPEAHLPPSPRKFDQTRTPAKQPDGATNKQNSVISRQKANFDQTCIGCV